MQARPHPLTQPCGVGEHPLVPQTQPGLSKRDTQVSLLRRGRVFPDHQPDMRKPHCTRNCIRNCKQVLSSSANCKQSRCNILVRSVYSETHHNVNHVWADLDKHCEAVGTTLSLSSTRCLRAALGCLPCKGKGWNKAGAAS